MSGAPVSSAQLRLLVDHDLDPTSAVYRYPYALWCSGPLDVGALERALEGLLERHEPLRTTFAGPIESAVQVVQDAPRIALQVHEHGDAPPGARDEIVRKVARALARLPMDLRWDLPLRVELVFFAPDLHVLVLVLHHVAVDTWSLGGGGHPGRGALVRDLAELYAARSAGRAPRLEPPALAYRAHAAWQRERAASPAADAALREATALLAGPPPLVDLSGGRPRDRSQRSPADAVCQVLSATSVAALRARCQREGVTMFMAFLAALAVELGRATRLDDITLLTSFAGRDQRGTEALVGNFINLLPVRLDLSGAPSFRALLARAREVVGGALRRREVPYERIVGALDLPRHAGRAVLSPILFELLPELMPHPVDAAGVSMQLRELPRVELDVDLNLVVTVGPHDITLVAHCAADALAGDAASRLLARVASTLERGMEEPERRPASFPLPRAEQALIDAWGQGAPAVASEPGLLPELARIAREDEARTAIVAGDTRVTYGAMLDAASSVAARLRAAGATLETLVAVHAARGPGFLAAVLGAFLAGAAYVPLDPRDPPDRRAQLLAASGAPILVTDRELCFAPPAAVGILDVREALEAPAGSRAEPEARPPGTLAYVIYTSGSTGAPKGAMVEHRGMVNHLRAKVVDLGLSAEDRVAQTAPIGFDISVWQLLAPLLVGGRVHVYDDDTVRDPERLFAAIARDEITVLELVPSLLAAALELPGLPERLALRWLVVTGEAFPPELARRWLARYPSIPLVNAYGPTECSDDVTHHLLGEPPPAGAARVPIGRPVLGTRLHVLDETLAPVPAGSIGELYVGGVGVGRGYLGDPARTAAAFAPDPTSTEAGARLYRTGDLARFLPDGAIDFLGRVDRQVKVRGHRIEPGEVEAVLAAHPDVRQAAVACRARGGEHLVAFVVPRSGDAERGALAAQLRARARSALPAAMVPAAIFVLDELPLTPNGKIDSKALAAYEAAPEPAAAEPAAMSAVERTLAASWSEVLGVPRIGKREDFFALGGDSIRVLHLVARAARAGLAILPSQVFTHPTIEELAAVAAPAGAPGGRGPASGDAPLTPFQRWSLTQARVDPSQWAFLVELELTRPLAVALIDAALDAVVAHHDALRLRVLPERGGRRQTYGAAAPRSPIARHDLAGLDPGARAGAQADIARGLRASLSLDSGPLVGAALVDTGGACVLLLAVCHLIADGASLSILIGDLETAWSALERGACPALPPRTDSFRACGERLLARTAAAEDTLPRWRAIVERSEPLPLDRPDRLGGDVEDSVLVVQRALSERETAILSAGARTRFHASVEQLVLSAFGRALTRWTGRAVLVDLERHGRDVFEGELDVTRTVGALATIHPVLIDAAPDGGPAAAVQAVKLGLAAVPEDTVSYGVLLHLAEHPALARLPRAEVLFDYLGDLDRMVSAGGPFRVGRLTSEGERAPRAPRPYRLELRGVVRRRRLCLELRYGPAVLDRETVDRLADDLEGALRALAATEDVATIEDVVPLTPAQEGILFHALADPASDAYVTQATWAVGAAEVAAWIDAWPRVAARHAALRASALWSSVPEPLLVIHRDAATPIERLDLTARDGSPDARLTAFLDEDRRRGFRLASPPLQRLTAVRVADDDWRMAWTHHHLILDGWSIQIVLSELAAIVVGREGERAAAPPSREVARRARARPDAAAQAFWRAHMEGARPASMPADAPDAPLDPAGGGPRWGEVHAALTMDETRAMVAAAKELRITLNTVVRAAWALSLARVAGAPIVVFGVTVSGRRADLPGSDAMVGMLMNTLPLAAPVPLDKEVGEWLRALHHRQAGLLEHEQSALVDIKRWCGWPVDAPLFETLVAFQSYPSRSASLRDLRLAVANHYPLTLRATPGDALALTLLHDLRRYGAAAATSLLSDVVEDLRAVAADPARRAGDLVHRRSRSARQRELSLLQAARRRPLKVGSAAR
ncbi:amino acid adenylation domain-containing protein [Sorangium sp. So ce362]|uniref:amino acid adenylation domain-containing protein n=1 Tax=Sorangium sp. So ce362 TaxID=3133303 RepID=UPI003F60E421